MPVATPQPVWSPVVGAPTEAFWAGNVAEAVVQRFATTAERDARWTTPPNGSICVTTNTSPPSMWQRSGSSWVQIGPPVVRDPFSGAQTIGGALTVQGMVTLPATNPTADNHATRRAWVLSQIGTRVAVSGDTMTGPLVLQDQPTGPGHATRKDYVDTQRDTRVATKGDTMTGALVLDGTNFTGDNVATRRRWQLDTFVQINNALVQGNLNMTGGRIVNVAAPSQGDHAAIASWVSSNFEAKSGSDYRMKEFVGPVTNATERIAALARAVYRGRWTDDGDTLVGVHNDGEHDFINAHDVAEVAPYAVYGDKDGEEMQTVDFRSLVPLLVSALGAALDRISTLEARLA